MVLSQEEANDIKKHLLQRLGSLPEDKREEIKEKVESMPVEEVEEFIKENKLTHLGGQCIFCSIVAQKTPSFKILEDKDYLAVLEINPLSKGHSLIIPKNHTQSASSEEIKIFAKKTAEILAKKLLPNEIKINGLKIMNHELLEIVPIFGNENERYQATEEELKNLQEEILKPTEPVKIEPKKEEKIKSEPLYRIAPRIP